MGIVATDDKLTKILVILGPSEILLPEVTSKKLNEFAVKMDNSWKIFVLAGHFTSRLKLPCQFELKVVPVHGPSKTALTRIIYLLNCMIRGVSLVKKESIQVVTQHDGHLEYGIVAYIVSRLTHRKCLIRVNEDTLIPLIFFLDSSGNRLFRNKTVLKAVSYSYRRMESFLFKHADWIVTHGPMDYQKIEEITPNITFVPLWVDTEKFKRLDKTFVRKFREDLGISENKKILLFVGRLHPEKGVKTLLQALNMVESKEFSLLLVYYVPEYEQEYASYAEDLGILDQVSFLGYVPHEVLPKYYNVADLYVIPSMREEWSNTIMEAMACETPVIATDVGGNPYIVIEGKTGFLVPPNDPKSLARKIVYACKDTELLMRVATGGAKEIKRYDSERIGELYKRVVRNLVK
jgi:glycosyltransferase involved in cell wall biosynthesis